VEKRAERIRRPRFPVAPVRVIFLMDIAGLGMRLRLGCRAVRF
jgi:hypothetical protein